ncbi:hypothetical protein Anae109_3340 [Anaeromyxobacter sp. Fw109-5]|nr:hypothetical protein Anae109_3340 [Anaeromyxobacter sp. Fw109-5]
MWAAAVQPHGAGRAAHDPRPRGARAQPPDVRQPARARQTGGDAPGVRQPEACHRSCSKLARPGERDGRVPRLRLEHSHPAGGSLGPRRAGAGTLLSGVNAVTASTPDCRVAQTASAQPARRT